MIRSVWTWVSVTALVASAVWFAAVLKADKGPDLSGKMAFDQKSGAQVPLDAEFLDEHGNTVKLGSYFNDRPVALMLVFYQCKGSCALEFEGATKAFRALQVDDIGKSFDVVTISIHPKETPALALAKKNDILESYSRKGAEQGWHFLTGKEDQINKVADAIGYKYYYDPAKDLIVHPTGLIMLTPGGRISRYFLGIEYSSPLLKDSITAARVNEIGPVAEKTYLLGCFQVDPNSGRMMLHVQRATQVLGAITLIALVSSIVVMNRKYKRHRHDALEDELNRISQTKEDNA
jgi:protein SCO1/2